MSFTPAETAACQRLVELALDEDLGPLQDFPERWVGDLTSKMLIPPDLTGRAAFVARSSGVLAGLPAAELVMQTARTPLLKLQPLMTEGSRVNPGDQLAVVTGLMEFILTVERTALNFLQHLSGIATVTRRYVDAVAGVPCQIVDTRKTTPGWRLLEKYAVRQGGGQNHRLGLYDAILIKDNHLAALGGTPNAFARVMLSQLKQQTGVPVEIEVDSLDQLDRALDCRPDMVLLDNMDLDQLREAVRRRAALAPKVLLEASGGVTLDTVRAIAETGVDRISVGALTHSAPALDIALDYLKA
jgi:nicotinate-nucleotide pyrophosphorylase (carboxylating)